MKKIASGKNIKPLLDYFKLVASGITRNVYILYQRGKGETWFSLFSVFNMKTSDLQRNPIKGNTTMRRTMTILNIVNCS